MKTIDRFHLDKIPELDGIYDTHFHLDEMAKQGIDIPSVLTACFAKGFLGGIDVAVVAEGFEGRMERIAPYPGIFLSAGLYPSEAEKDWKSKLPEVEKQCRGGRIAAVGETGIDLYRNYATVEKQAALFRAQVELAEACGLPLIVHCRKAEIPILKILRETKPSSRGVIHCFSGEYTDAAAFIDLGFFVSFAGNLTYPKSTVLQDAARRLPLESILLETDAPYLSPTPLRGRRNTPGFVGHTYAFLAELRRTPPDEIKKIIGKNVVSCFPSLSAPQG